MFFLILLTTKKAKQADLSICSVDVCPAYVLESLLGARSVLGGLCIEEISTGTRV